MGGVGPIPTDCNTSDFLQSIQNVENKIQTKRGLIERRGSFQLIAIMFKTSKQYKTQGRLFDSFLSWCFRLEHVQNLSLMDKSAMEEEDREVLTLRKALKRIRIISPTQCQPQDNRPGSSSDGPLPAQDLQMGDVPFHPQDLQLDDDLGADVRVEPAVTQLPVQQQDLHDRVCSATRP